MVRPLGERTRLLTVLLWLTTGASAVWLFATPFIYFELVAASPEAHVDDVGGLFLMAAGTVAGLQTPLTLVTIVVFFMWVHRVTANLRTLTQQDMRFTPGWAVGWYFVPILSLVRPYQGMLDIWRGSHGGSRDGESLVRLWWALVLLSGLAISVAGAATADGETVRDFIDALLLESPGYVLDVALYALTLRMVSAIGRAYDRSVSEWALEHPTVPAGWYPDPSQDTRERYWDGAAWSDATREVVGPRIRRPES